MNDFVNRSKSYVEGEAELTNWNRQAKKPGPGRSRAFPAYSASKVRSGIKALTSQTRPNISGFVSIARVENQSAAGSIYETAGRKNPIYGQKKDPYLQNKRQFFADPSRGELPWEKRYRATSHKYSASNNPRAGQQFLAALPKLWNADPKAGTNAPGKRSRKMTGRLIFRAQASDNGKTVAKLMHAIETFNKRLGYRDTVVKKVA